MSLFTPWAIVVADIGEHWVSTVCKNLAPTIVTHSRTRGASSRQSFCWLATMLLLTLPSASSAEGVDADHGKDESRVFASVLLRSDNERGAAKLTVISIDPVSGKWTKLADAGGAIPVSPDGETFAFTKSHPLASGNIETGVWTADTGGGNNPGRVFADGHGVPVWSPDGKQVVTSVLQHKDSEQQKGMQFQSYMFRSDGLGGSVRLPLLPSDRVEDWSPDGKWLAVVGEAEREEQRSQIYLVRPDGTGRKQLTQDGDNSNPRFSPDGRWIVHRRVNQDAGTLRMIALDGSKEREIMRSADGQAAPGAACWSPDGKFLAVVVYDQEMPQAGAVPSAASLSFRLVVVDVAGNEQRDVQLADATAVYFGYLDWR